MPEYFEADWEYLNETNEAHDVAHELGQADRFLSLLTSLDTALDDEASNSPSEFDSTKKIRLVNIAAQKLNSIKDSKELLSQIESIIAWLQQWEKVFNATGSLDQTQAIDKLDPTQAIDKIANAIRARWISYEEINTALDIKEEHWKIVYPTYKSSYIWWFVYKELVSAEETAAIKAGLWVDSLNAFLRVSKNNILQAIR